jgi:syntaxin 1B/2/3
MANFGGEQDLTKFFDEVEKIKVDMDKIKQLLVKLQEANEESKGVHKAQAMKGIRDRMDKDIAQVNKIARSIKAKLEDLDKGNAASRKVKGCEEGTPTDRTRMSITNNQRKKLKDLMGEFQVLRERMMNEYKETIERRSFAIYTLIVSAHEFGKFWLNFCRLHVVDLSSSRIRFATKSLSQCV